MNFFRLCKNLYAGSYVKLVILFLVMTLAMQSLTMAVGMLRYNQMLFEQIDALQSVRGAYLMQFENGEAAFAQENIQKMQDQIANLPGVRQVCNTRELYVRSNNENYTVVLYNDWMVQYFKPQGIRGAWLDAPDSAIVSVYGAKRNIINREILLEFQYGDEKILYPIEVTGTMEKPSYIPKFSRSGTLLSWQGLLHASYGHLQRYVIVSEDSALYRTYRDAFHDYRNFLVLLDEKVPLETMQTLSTMGLVMEFGEIRQNTENECDTNMFYVRYLLLFSSMSLILVLGMSLSFVREKHRELAVYAICGCNRGRKLILSCLGMITVTVISCLLQSIVIHFFYDLKLYQILEYAVIDSDLILLIVGYTLLVGVVSMASVYMMNVRKRPIDILQENRK